MRTKRFLPLTTAIVITQWKIWKKIGKLLPVCLCDDGRRRRFEPHQLPHSAWRLVDLLSRLFDEVVLPHAVFLELTNQSAPPVVQLWSRQLPDWASIRKATVTEDLKLDPGETEAILLAEQINAFAVLVDETEARRAARSRGLRITGTIGILERAAEAGIIDLPDALERLKKTNFHGSSQLFSDALERDALRRRQKI